MSDMSGDDLAASIIAEANGPVEKKSILPTIAAVGILTLVAAGGGALVGSMITSSSVTAEKAEQQASETLANGEAHGDDVIGDKGEKDNLKKAGGLTTVDLQPVVTNLYAPQNVWIRIEASVIVKDKEVENKQVLAAQVEADTITFLRSVQLAQIEGSRGLLHLHEDLVERAKLRSPAITDYVIRTLVVE